MHPALSVIIFTTASGAGYGLLALVGILVWHDMMPMDHEMGGRGLGMIVLGLGVGMVSGGLLSSTYHLGHPERAWRAFSQWRSSWLSREGVAAMLSYVPAAVVAWFWLVEGNATALSSVGGLVLSILSLLTIYCTAMIYRSLATIPEWHNPITVSCYLTFGIMTGALLLNAVLLVFGDGVSVISVLAVVFCLAGLMVKVCYWRHIDRHQAPGSTGTATGLGELGRVVPFEAPHSADNYLMKEMGYVIARKHAVKLRRMALVGGFVVPLILSIMALLLAPAMAGVAAVLAVLVAAVGIGIERWLFFAEATHVVTHYYR